MAESSSIKTDLFRFLTVRSPQLIAREKKSVGFVRHPNPKESHFLAGLSSDELQESRKAVVERAESFKTLGSIHSLQDLHAKLYDFSQKLYEARGKKNELYRLIENLGVGLLTGESLIRVWDELFYRVVTREQGAIRQVCIQLLVADHFLRMVEKLDVRKQTKEADDGGKLLKRIAKSKVIIPKVFAKPRGPRKEVPDQEGKDKPAVVVPPVKLDLERLELDHIFATKQGEINELRKLRGDLVAARRSPDADKYDVAKTFADRKGKAVHPITEKYLKYQEVDGVNFSRILHDVESLTQKKQRELAEAVQKLKRHREANPMKTKAPIPLYGFVLTHQPVFNAEEFELILTIHAGYSEAFISAAEYQLVTSNGQKYSSTGVVEMPTEKRQQVTLRLFPKQEVLLAENQTFTVHGTLTFDRGESVSFSLQTNLAKKIVRGRGQLLDHNEARKDDEVTVLASRKSEKESPELYGVNRLGVAVFRKVEQEACCYVPGEVSHIENILAREYKERHTRSLTSTETTSETTSATEMEKQTDTATSVRNELQSEIAAELNRSIDVGVGTSIGVSASYGGAVTVNANTSFDFGYSNASSSSNSQARTFAEEITQSALERVVQKTTTKRTSRVLKEFEENNRHGFDNRQGADHVTGVYRWIDIIYTNRLVNYGKRLLIEFLIPEPASFYLWLQEQAKLDGESESDAAIEPQPPRTLAQEGINSARDIEREEYIELGTKFGTSLEDPISPEFRTEDIALVPKDDPQGKPDPNKKDTSYTFPIQIPYGYRLAATDIAVRYEYHFRRAEVDGLQTYMEAEIAGYKRKHDGEGAKTDDGKGDLIYTGTGDTKFKTMNLDQTFTNNLTSGLKLTLKMDNIHDFTVSGSVDFEVDDNEFRAWQDRNYIELQNAYNRQYAAYQEELAAFEQEAGAKAEAEDEETPNSNPGKNRIIEQRELKRSAIEMLAHPFGIQIGADFVEPGRCGIPTIQQKKGWENYSSLIKFFEQAFDWSLIDYIFYPYYWADRCDWETKLNDTKTNDPIFEGFLQSGMARVVVPVTQGFEDAIDYFLETGDIWNGGDLVIDTDDDLYVSIAEEMQEIEGYIEEEWETRVPTALTIVQGKSAFLEEEGLPCCHADAADPHFKVWDKLLQNDGTKQSD